MRVIAGKFRSRPLHAPKGMDVRPTSDRLRETLFNILASGNTEIFRDCVWIDAFAGSGAVGIEAVSRGANSVYFLEHSRIAARTIRENLKSLGIEDGFEVQERDAVKSLRMLEQAAVVCDFCFLDPPYADGESYEQALDTLGQSQLLKPTSIVIAEHDKRLDPGTKFGALERYRLHEQGDAGLSFYRLR